MTNALFETCIEFTALTTLLSRITRCVEAYLKNTCRGSSPYRDQQVITSYLGGEVVPHIHPQNGILSTHTHVVSSEGNPPSQSQSQLSLDLCDGGFPSSN